MLALVADIRAMVDAHEAASGARKRARKPVDQRHFETAVEVVVANLAHAVLVPPETGRIAVLTGNGARGATRYANRALGEPLRALLGTLGELGVLDWQWTGKRHEASSLAPTEAFRERVHGAGVTLADFGRVPGEETIILSQKVRSSMPSGEAPLRKLVNYPDAAEADAMRHDMKALNGFLSSADIRFVEDGLGPVDTSNRTLRRHFVRQAGDTDAAFTFDLSGRLFGGFWQTMKSERRAGIRINGEPVAELDYGQMAVRLAHAHVGATPPEGDMYALPGLEGHRAAVKTAVNVLLNDTHRRNAWPSSLTEAGDGADAEASLPEGWTVAKVRAAVLARHPALAPCLSAGLGLRLMHTESEILVSVLKEMMARGIVGLGIHDGLLTPASKSEEVRRIMVEEARIKAGTTIPVSVTGLYVQDSSFHL
ncbi:hypothetical protein [Ancylobacter amanitiformis]|uniref:DNA-directed DNA polymerase family A palm domain-containing protein n=1 Tax=Ancylobacter amanitiformis TaxID=217069 RepID=A0ABU0LPP8_9HYPH|nr:hypothetical protein [Ancylobacter amanitiformis]MDQ0510633.1 hypothetical protein [Ancylobacter amanitiformis]